MKLLTMLCVCRRQVEWLSRSSKSLLEMLCDGWEEEKSVADGLRVAGRRNSSECCVVLVVVAKSRDV